MGRILFSGLPLPRHLLTHIQAPARVTRPTASQPGQSRCLFSTSPRENSLPAGNTCLAGEPVTPSWGLSHPFSPSPRLPPPPHFLPSCSWIFPLQERPQDPGQGPQVQLPDQDTCFLHQLAPSALPGGRKSDPGLGNRGALHGGQPKVILSLPLPPARAQPEEP